jgi:hypothetical protein
MLELPPGTIFPTEHTLLLIDRAKVGEKSFAKPVFDGATLDGAMEINGGSARAPPIRRRRPGLARELLSGGSWRVRMAFFRLDTQRGTEPEYETSMRSSPTASAASSSSTTRFLDQGEAGASRGAAEAALLNAAGAATATPRRARPTNPRARRRAAW